MKITLSKLRSIKKEMYNIAKEVMEFLFATILYRVMFLQNGVDLAAVAHAYVYFEKLVLMVGVIFQLFGLQCSISTIPKLITLP